MFSLIILGYNVDSLLFLGSIQDPLCLYSNNLYRSFFFFSLGNLQILYYVLKTYIDHFFFSWEFAGETNLRSSKWEPSIPHFVNINFDVAMREEKSCIAVVGRNHERNSFV